MNRKYISRVNFTHIIISVTLKYIFVSCNNNFINTQFITDFMIKKTHTHTHTHTLTSCNNMYVHIKMGLR